MATSIYWSVLLSGPMGRGALVVGSSTMCALRSDTHSVSGLSHELWRWLGRNSHKSTADQSPRTTDHETQGSYSHVWNDVWKHVRNATVCVNHNTICFLFSFIDNIFSSQKCQKLSGLVHFVAVCGTLHNFLLPENSAWRLVVICSLHSSIM